MNFEKQNGMDNPPKLGEMYESLSALTKQLAVFQGFLENKFGSEFTSFCQLSEQTFSSTDKPVYASSVVADVNSMNDDGEEEYDKMPNLISQESPSRTLGYVTVPLRQSTSSGVPTPKLQPAPGNGSSGTTKRDKCNSLKEEVSDNDNEDIYPLHNFPDLLVGNTGEMDTNETPEFLELELDPSALLRGGEPPALHPMFSDTNGHEELEGGDNNTHISKRSGARHNGNNFSRFDSDTSSRSTVSSRRASVGGHENNNSQKKFDCLVCGIKFEFVETLKSHMDSHAGSRNIRSNSEDQSSGLVCNSSAPPLPKLMPRPIIPSSPSADGSVSPAKDVISELSDTEAVVVKKSKPKRVPSSPHSTGAPSSSSSSNSKTAAMKRRKKYNQTRPCSLACPECGLKIRDRSRLIEHLRGHTGERPFQCSFCDKSYTRKDVMKTHMLKMHGAEAAESFVLPND